MAAVDLYGHITDAPPNATWGDTIAVSSQVARGSVASAAPFRVEWYLSRDGVGSADDVRLPLTNGQTGWNHPRIDATAARGPVMQPTLRLPSRPQGWTGESFYVITKTDSAGSVSELNENNNFGTQNGADRDILRITDPMTSVRRVEGSLSGTNPATGRANIPVFLERIDGTATAPIQRGLRTWVVIHGRDNNSTSPAIRELAETIGRHSQTDQVLMLDWGAGAFDNRSAVGLQGAYWIPAVAHWAGEKLQTLGITGANLNLVGHSWGSYVAHEIASQRLGGRPVNSLLAIDPAGNSQWFGSPYQGQVNFAANATNSWCFEGSALLGNNDLARTARETIRVETNAVDPREQHTNVVRLVTSLLRENNAGVSRPVSSRFTLERLLQGGRGPWGTTTLTELADYEARLVAQEANGTWVPQTLQYRTANGHAVLESVPTLLTGRNSATDSGAGLTRSTARNLGRLTSQPRRVESWIGASNPTDYYRFEVTRRSQVRFELASATGRPAYFVLESRSGSDMFGTPGSPITLDPGTYYFRVQAWQTTDYRLEVSAT